MLSYKDKRKVEREICSIIKVNSIGINTRTLISRVINNLATTIPNLNKHHVAGMLAWVLKNNSCHFMVRSPGYSIIA